MTRYAWIAALLLLAAPTPSHAADPAPANAADPTAAGSADPPAAGPVDPTDTARYEDQRASWQSRFREARTVLSRAETRYYDALDAYAAMRHRRRTRGEAKRAVMDELREAEVALDEARAALGALHEEARRAGVPPGWIRDAGGPPPADFAPRR